MSKNLKQKNPFLVGLATFFFGFGAPAVFNLILFAVKSPLVLQFRSSLNFVSAIIGDGIILPLVNTLIASFIVKNKEFVNKLILMLSLLMGIMITFYFHITQAINSLVNWSMPKPWQWNLLGLWHFLYMLAVTSFISFYFLILIKKIRKERVFPKETFWVIGGIIVFLILLKFDYTRINLLE